MLRKEITIKSIMSFDISEYPLSMTKLYSFYRGNLIGWDMYEDGRVIEAVDIFIKKMKEKLHEDVDGYIFIANEGHLHIYSGGSGIATIRNAVGERICIEDDTWEYSVY